MPGLGREAHMGPGVTDESIDRLNALYEPSCAGLARVSTWIQQENRREQGVDGRIKSGHDDLGNS